MPAIIETNPFQTDDSESDSDNKPDSTNPAVAKIVNIFNDILAATKQFQLHPQITSQLFAYLFFFSNASLFNSLMEKGQGGKFYKWTKGVQMRGNLDMLEEWAKSNGLHSQYEQYMSKFVSAVDLLSTPKVQMMAVSINCITLPIDKLSENTKNFSDF